MDYNSTFLGLIVAGVILVAIGFGLVLAHPAVFRPASAVIAIQSPTRGIDGTVGNSRLTGDRTGPAGTNTSGTSPPE